MTDQHPIAPSLELVQQWTDEIYGGPGVVAASDDICLAKLAAQWGYDQRGEVNEAKLRKARDQELEACCEWLREAKNHGFGYEYGAELARRLRAARRPKPPSLKEQACKLLECYGTSGVQLTADQCNTILRALKALPND